MTRSDGWAAWSLDLVFVATMTALLAFSGCRAPAPRSHPHAFMLEPNSGQWRCFYCDMPEERHHGADDPCPGFPR